MMPLQDMPADARCRSLRTAVDETLAAAIRTVEPPRLKAALAHALDGGKRVRPLVTMFACGAAGGRETDAVDAAAAVELLHTSSLVHDDIMDRSPLRRGRPTLHVHYDVPTAVLAGDMLIALAFRLIQHQETQRPAALLRTFTSSFVALCEGQGLDLDLSGRDAVQPGLHAAMVERKTARVLEASAAIGALVATGEEEIVQAAATFGRHLGMAFQAHDDLLDATGDAAVMGKPAGQDAQNGRHTYLSLAWPQAEGPSGADPLAGARAVVARHTGRACHTLDGLPPSPSREMLRMLAATLTERRR